VREGKFCLNFQINVNELVSGMADLHDNERVEAAVLRSVTGIWITTETMFPAFREAFLKNKKINWCGRG
jgi:hypothetical protein